MSTAPSQAQQSRPGFEHRQMRATSAPNGPIHIQMYFCRPTGAWVTQQARNLSWRIGDGDLSPKILIRYRDSKFVTAFDEIFRSEGIKKVKTPPRSPRANSVAERWIQSSRREALDRILIFGERHLLAVMAEYVDHYNRARPHRGLGLDIPIPQVDLVASGPIVRRQRLGGVINEYSRLAA